MNSIFKQFLDKFDEIHGDISAIDLNMKSNIDAFTLKLNELRHILYFIQVVNTKISNVYNIYKNRHKLLIKTPNRPSIGTNVSWRRPHNLCTAPRTVQYDSPPIQLAPNISVATKVVNSVDEIPNIPLYWVSNIEQYAFKVNGVVFRGTMGNIYNKNDIKKTTNKSTKIKQMAVCHHKNNCITVLNNGICEFYHDPLDLLTLLEASLITHATYRKYIKLRRNFSNTSWIYTDSPQNKNNSAMRHFGSRDTLKHNFDLIKFEPSSSDITGIDNFRQQCMHDILVIMGLNQANLLKDAYNTDTDISYVDDKNPFYSLADVI